MAQPTFVAAGELVRGTGAVTPLWPAGVQANDIGLLFVETANQAASLSTPSDFASVTNQGTGTGGTVTSTRLTVFWCRASGSSPAAPVVADSGARQNAAILVFRGCIESGDPWDVLAGNTAASTTAVSIPTATTTVDETLAVLAVSNGALIDAPMLFGITNSSLTQLVGRFNSQLPGTGGVDPGLTPLPVGIASYSTIGDGPPADASGPTWGLLQYSPTPGGISGDLDDADRDNVLLILQIAGNKPAWRDPTGAFSIALYRQQLDRFVAPNISSTIAAKLTDAAKRRRAVFYAVDEPNLDNEMTPTQVNQMCGEIKARWPDSLVIVRCTPTLLASSWSGNPLPPGGAAGYSNVDYCWSQYSRPQSSGLSTPTQIWAAERAIITSRSMNMGMFVSLNLWAGGNTTVLDAVQPCWDTDNNGVGTTGYILGDREAQALKGTFVACGALGTPVPSVIASPDWIKNFADKATADADIPALLFWNYAPGTVSDEYTDFYNREDYEEALDYAITKGATRTNWTGWRTPK